VALNQIYMIYSFFVESSSTRKSSYIPPWVLMCRGRGCGVSREAEGDIRAAMALQKGDAVLVKEARRIQVRFSHSQSHHHHLP
jgi:hypothetical protein